MRCYGGADGVTRNLWAPGIVAGVQLDLSANLRLGKGLIGERNQACVSVRPTHLPDPDAKGDGVHLIRWTPFLAF